MLLVRFVVEALVVVMLMMVMLLLTVQRMLMQRRGRYRRRWLDVVDVQQALDRPLVVDVLKVEALGEQTDRLADEAQPC